MLWVDKYRPKTLDKVTVHDQVAQNLKKLVGSPPPPPPFPRDARLRRPTLGFRRPRAVLMGVWFVFVFFCQVAEQDCPHLLFYGPSGSGKKTLVMALIKQMFGAGADKVSFCN